MLRKTDKDFGYTKPYRSKTYVEVVRGKEIGTLCIEDRESGHVIWNVKVHEEYRGKGFAVRMMRHALKLRKGKFKLWVGKDNEVARHVYEKVGFKVEFDHPQVCVLEMRT